MLIDNTDGRYSGLPELFNVDEGFISVRAEQYLREDHDMTREEARELAIMDVILIQYPVPAPVVEPVPEPAEVPVEVPIVPVPAPVEEVTPDIAISQEDLFGDPHV